MQAELQSLLKGALKVILMRPVRCGIFSSIWSNRKHPSRSLLDKQMALAPEVATEEAQSWVSAASALTMAALTPCCLVAISALA
mmetsp:Transcript_707/g.1545  ORF Transcript_707/g.1545 Transcript_707/m.1545 type:complete len:84 (+) Transcript_707:271-522(+)